MRLKPLDAIWLFMESSQTPMHVGVLAVFQLPARASRGYLATLARQLRSAAPVAPWHMRLVDTGVGLLGQRLVEESDFDIDYHFRHLALPAPGGERELGVAVSRMHSQALDRNRPLWEFHLIEGLERNRFAVYLKLHHALVNDVTAVPLLLSCLTEKPQTRAPKPPWATPLDLSANATPWPLDTREALDLLAHPVDAVNSLRRAGAGLLRKSFQRGAQSRDLLPRGTPRSTLNRRINSQRRFATQQFPRARIERLAQAADTTLSTILAYLCGSSLRRFFKEYNALPDESLIAALPVSLQERSELLSGNAIAGLRVPLGTHIGDPLQRLEVLKVAIAAVREDRESLPAVAVTPYVMLRSAPLYMSQLPAVGSLVPPLFNLTVTSTPGPETPRYWRGARLEAIYPLGQLMQYNALSIDCVSYADTLNIGFTGARDTLPHLQRLAVYTGKAVRELEELLELAGRAA